MVITRRPLLLGAATSGLLVCNSAAQTAADFNGEWHGVIDAGSQGDRFRLIIEGSHATLVRVDQGSEEVAESVVVEGDRLRLTFPSIKAAYDGRLSERRIVGHFTQGERHDLVFARSEAVAAGLRPLSQARLNDLRKRAGAPALAAAAENRDGRQIFFVDGNRAHGRSEAVSTSDCWHLGSITKSMTATLVARCVEAGVIEWDQTVGGVLGNAIPDMRIEYRDVTFRHLLSHRAGLQANIRERDFLRYQRENSDPRAERIAFARQALRQKPVGATGTSFAYSNNGYVVVGAMLESILGAPWESLIRQRVFDPLAMTTAGFGAPGSMGAYDQPVGHSQAFGTLDPHFPGELLTDNPAALGPAGRVHASLGDVLKFLVAHRDRITLLRSETWTVLQTPPFGGTYAMGWDVHSGALWHSGSNELWYAGVMVSAVRGVAAIAATNDGRLRTSAPAVVSALLGAAEAVD